VACPPGREVGRAPRRRDRVGPLTRRAALEGRLRAAGTRTPPVVRGRQLAPDGRTGALRYGRPRRSDAGRRRPASSRCFGPSRPDTGGCLTGSAQALRSGRPIQRPGVQHRTRSSSRDRRGAHLAGRARGNPAECPPSIRRRARPGHGRLDCNTSSLRRRRTRYRRSRTRTPSDRRWCRLRDPRQNARSDPQRPDCSCAAAQNVAAARENRSRNRRSALDCGSTRRARSVGTRSGGRSERTDAPFGARWGSQLQTRNGAVMARVLCRESERRSASVLARCGVPDRHWGRDSCRQPGLATWVATGRRTSSSPQAHDGLWGGQRQDPKSAGRRRCEAA
jgi:hypothetical protein